MANVYTVSLGRGRGGLNEQLELFFVPGLDTYVLRDIVGFVFDTTPAYFQIFQTPPGGSPLLIYYAVVTGPSTVHLDLRQVLAPGGRVFASSGHSSWSTQLTGYHLLGQTA